MAAVPVRSDVTSSGLSCALPAAPRDPGERALLEAVRAWARAAQRAARLDLDGVCSLIDPPPGAGPTLYGAALLRALDTAAARPMTFHPRGAAAMAFGEAWTLRLLLALRNRDRASALFLVRSGVRRERRRQVLWIADRLAACLAAPGAASGKTGTNDLESFQASEPILSQPAPQRECKEHA